MKSTDEQLHFLERRILLLEELLSKVFDTVGAEKQVCPCCGQEIRLYTPHGSYGSPIRRNARCPACGALERHRLLWLYLQTRQDREDKTRLLHFAPEKFFYDMFSENAQYDYWPVDYNADFPRKIRKTVDIQNLDFESSYFDEIICSHVLEHIPDDAQAISELHRVLKEDGVAYIMVPQRYNQPTLEKPEYNTPELRAQYYGQNDHVRFYGYDFPERLKRFDIKEIRWADFLSQQEADRYKVSDMDIIYECRKRGKAEWV